MPLCNLPEDILVIVLGKCVGTSIDTARDFKRSLPLLAVCRVWRRLTVPAVYKHAFVQCRERLKRSGGWFHHNIMEEPTDIAIQTNLDLVSMVGYARAVRHVHIDVNSVANPLPGLREVAQRAHTVASEWRVMVLSVAIHAKTFVDRRNVDMAKYEIDISEIGGALVALMPDLRCLEYDGFNHSPIARSLYGCLAGHYADQLQWFESKRASTAPLDCLFRSLKKVNISYDNVDDYRLPQMATGELVDMSLMNGPSNHSWASFSTDSDSQMIEFAKLKRLCVGYRGAHLVDGAAVRHRDGHPWKLHFPILKILSVRCWQEICPLFEYAVLPPHMESIAIDMHSASYQNIASLVLPATRCLSLSITSDTRGDPSGLPVINQILESARGSKWLELNINDPALPIAPESITCTALTHFQVAASTSLDTMLAFIARFSNLIRLSIYDLDLSNIQADISVPEADVDTAVETLHTSLTALSIDYGMRRHSEDAAMAVVKYVLLAIPTLTELIASNTLKRQVAGFVETYAPRHPHLSRVKLRSQ